MEKITRIADGDVEKLRLNFSRRKNRDVAPLKRFEERETTFDDKLNDNFLVLHTNFILFPLTVTLSPPEQCCGLFHAVKQHGISLGRIVLKCDECFT